MLVASSGSMSSGKRVTTSMRIGPTSDQPLEREDLHELRGGVDRLDELRQERHLEALAAALDQEHLARGVRAEARHRPDELARHELGARSLDVARVELAVVEGRELAAIHEDLGAARRLG